MLSDDAIHLCVQCSKCLKTIKTEKHGGKLFLKQSDIPPASVIFDYIDPQLGMEF